MKPGVFAAVFLLLGTASASAATPDGPGTVFSYVLSYNGPAKAYEIIRGDKRIGIETFLNLLPGDKVRVVDADSGRPDDAKNQITLSVGNQRVDLDFDSGRYCIGSPSGNCSLPPAPAGPPSAWSVIVANVCASVGAMLGAAQADQYTAQAEGMASRGGGTSPIRIALLAPGGQRIVSGTRALAIEWTGGAPPFRVSLHRAGTSAVLEALDASGQSATFPAAALPDGSYRLEIADDAGHTGSGTFEAVPAADLPAPTPDEGAVAADASLPADMRTTLVAATLAGRAPNFGFEAYQRIAPIGQGYEPADLLRYRLTHPR
jgi:hypothetical protein